MAFGPWMMAPGFSAGIETGTISTATSRIPEYHPFHEVKPEFRTWRWRCHGPAEAPGHADLTSARSEPPIPAAPGQVPALHPSVPACTAVNWPLPSSDAPAVYRLAGGGLPSLSVPKKV